MQKVGLTGNIGSGKSVVAKIFETIGVPVYNADAKAKNIFDTPTLTQEIISTFGKSVVDKSGKINREKLANIVFSNEKQLVLLNSLVHPAVINDFKNWTCENDISPYVIMESAILFDTEYYKLFDKIIVVSTPEEIKIARVIKRDNVSGGSVYKRLQNQKPESEIIGKAQFVIVNDNKSLVIPQVLSIHDALLMA